MIQEPISPNTQIRIPLLKQQQQQQQRQTEKQSEQQQTRRREFVTTETIAYPIPITLPQTSQRILLIESPVGNSSLPKTVRVLTQARIIRVPFLPRSEPIALLVNPKSLTKNGSVKNFGPNTASIPVPQCPNANDSQTIHDQLSEGFSIYSSPSSSPNTNISSNSSSNCSYQVFYPNQSQQQQIPEYQELQPMTLASMAGIQLTAADESPMEMSGAMPPIATVEEINVPVFIDEYLQQATQAPSTPAEAAAETLIFNNSNNNSSDINGNENLEFDIEIIAEQNNTIDGMMMQKNNTYPYNCNSVDNSNNNIDNNNKYTATINTYNNDNQMINNNNYNINNNNYQKLEPKEEPQYLISPGFVHCILSEDTSTMGLDAGDNVFTEEAVDISAMDNDNYSFSEFFTHSQNDPMLCDPMNSLSEKFNEAEPVVPTTVDYESEFAEDLKKSYVFPSEDIELNTTFADDTTTTMTTSSTLPTNTTTTNKKRRQSVSHHHMDEKRRKLHLNITQNPSMDALKTPDVVKMIMDMEKLPLHPIHMADSSTEAIMNSLLNEADSLHSIHSPNAQTVFWTTVADNKSSSTTTSHINNNSAVDSDDSFANTTFNSSSIFDENPQSIAASPSSMYTTDDDPPYTPHSNVSSTNHTTRTGYTTSPNSPALSTNSTATTHTKKRGRPSKEHSDRPDQEQMNRLSEAERKKLEDRAKNNEASRLSRLKNKRKEEAEIEEANRLMEQNVALKAELEHYTKMNAKLKRAFQRIHFGTK